MESIWTLKPYFFASALIHLQFTGFNFTSSPNKLGFVLMVCTLSFWSCEKTKVEKLFVPNTGQIQILNGSGKSGAAEVFRDFLTDQGFDVIEFGNASNWNYSQTLVVARSEKKQIAKDLARIMNTENLITLLDSTAMVEATVFVGKDYEELIKKWQKQKQ